MVFEGSHLSDTRNRMKAMREKQKEILNALTNNSFTTGHSYMLLSISIGRLFAEQYRISRASDKLLVHYSRTIGAVI